MRTLLLNNFLTEYFEILSFCEETKIFNDKEFINLIISSLVLLLRMKNS